MNAFVLDWVLRQQVAKNVNMFHIYSLPLPRLSPGDPFFDAIVPRAARLTCTRAEFAPLWREVMGTDWTPDAVLSPHPSVLRNQIDALVAHLYGLTRAEFDHILGTFPLVFPDTPEGQTKRAELLRVYDEV